VSTATAGDAAEAADTLVLLPSVNGNVDVTLAGEDEDEDGTSSMHG
jgi:hypothetical protein